MTTGQQPTNQRNLSYYCERFSQLQVHKNKGRGEAPYKPILLLSVIALISQGIINQNRIDISEDLINTFNFYRDILGAGEFKSSLSLPFFHLKNEDFQFWYLEFNPEYDGLPQTNERLRKSLNQLKKYVKYAYLDNELFDLLQDQDSRKELNDILIEVWFSIKQNDVIEILRINQDFQEHICNKVNKLEEFESRENKPKQYVKNFIPRNPFFGQAVALIYSYQCAFCHLRVTGSLTQNIVDGAHIKPFAKFYDSQIDNGIAFCKNHHWAFDKGLFAIDENYKIIVSSDLEEYSPHAKTMKEFEGEEILLPNSEELFPRVEALQWHRENVFRAS